MLEEKTVPGGKRLLLAIFAGGFIVATAVWAVLTALLSGGHGTASKAQSSVADQALAALVAQEVTDLGIKPKTAVLASDQALDATNAIKHGDYAAAGRIAKDVLSHTRLGGWRFYPFDEFMESLGRGDDPDFLSHLNAWLAREPSSSIAYLIRAAYYERSGRAARGDDIAAHIPVQQRELFDKDMELAAADLQKSIALDSRIPWSYYLLLEVASSYGNTPQMEAAFQAGIKAFPAYYPLYRLRLYSLTPKWGGSRSSMNAFVERYAGSDSDRSPMKLLYLQLYAYLLDAAWIDCDDTQNAGIQQCIKAVMGHTSSPDLSDGVLKALSLYKTSNPFEFNRAVWPILNQMVSTPGSGASALGAVLQVAANIMGSDNRIMDESGHNNYVLDDITARVWEQIGNTANADKKFRDALSDVRHTSFSEEAQKDEALAEILDDMTSFSDSTSQFINMIAYQDAANAVGGSNRSDTPYYRCYAYYRLKHFTAAVTECTRLIESNGNYPQTHYWRAKAYEGLRQWDASLADFAPVAESSNNWFRVGAALDMSYIYGEKKDVAGELASLNEHAYLFDPSLQSPDDLAVSYNNRCYAYMQLGQLRKALDDCTTSLKYGRIPDAYRKQLELMKLLTKNSL